MLRAALNDTDRISIALTANDAQEATELTGYYHPAVMILDLELPSTDAAKIIAKIHTASPHTKIVTISADK